MILEQMMRRLSDEELAQASQEIKQSKQPPFNLPSGIVTDLYKQYCKLVEDQSVSSYLVEDAILFEIADRYAKLISARNEPLVKQKEWHEELMKQYLVKGKIIGFNQRRLHEYSAWDIETELAMLFKNLVCLTQRGDVAGRIVNLLNNEGIPHVVEERLGTYTLRIMQSK